MPFRPVAIPRSDCGFESVELVGVPKAQRRVAVDNYLQRNVPLKKFHRYVLYGKNRAAIWYWPSNDKSLDGLSLPCAVPSSLFVTQPPREGWLKIEVEQGWDIQEWKHGEPLRSIYCETPDAVESVFASVGGPKAEQKSRQACPMPLVYDDLRKRWWASRLAISVVTGVFLLNAYWGVQGLWFASVQSSLDKSNQVKELALAPVVELRNEVAALKALAADIQVETTSSLATFVSVIDLLPPDVRVQAVKVIEGALSLRMELGKQNSPEFIAKLESLPNINSVEIDANGVSNFAWVTLHSGGAR